jgi:Bacterial Ig-like domain (group 3)
VPLHPGPPYQLSEALGAGGGQQVGYVYYGFYCSECGRYIFEHAALWSGSSASFTLLHMAHADQTRALDTDGTQQVGFAFFNQPNTPPYHALLWHGAGAAPTDLHPGPNFTYSFATSIADGQQGGYGWGAATDDYSHALLWRGTAASVVDLNPPGFYSSTVNAVRGGIQVGGGGRFSDSHGSALAWSGTAASVIDLHALLPAGYRLRDSVANDVDENGNIVGLATEDETAQTVAVVWKRTDSQPLRPAPTGLTCASPTALPGQTISLSATLKRSSDGAAVGGRTITFKVNGTSAGTAVTNSAGIATRKYSVPMAMSAGSKPIAVSFSGDSSFQASGGSATLTVRSNLDVRR